MASNPTMPNTFVNGTPADAAQVNANFAVLTAWIAANAMQIDGTVAFSAIPSGPNSDPVSANQFARKSYVDAITPSGSIIMFGGSAAPSGWLLCQGQAVSRATYATLFGVLGTSFGVGDGSTTFNLPNFQGRIPVGLNAGDADFNVLGKTGGQKTVAAHLHTMGNHVHSISGHTHGMTHNHTISGTSHPYSQYDFVMQNTNNPGGSVATAAGPYTALNIPSTTIAGALNIGPSSVSDTGGPSTPNTGAPSSNNTDSAGAGANNMNPFQVVNFIIKT